MSLKSACEALGISSRRAKGLAQTGMRFCSFEEAEARVGVRIEDYNRLYVHSALDYLSPEELAQ